MSSAKEPVTFKLTLTLTPLELSLLQEGLEHNRITVNEMCNKATAR